MGTYARRASGETVTSWPFTPTLILANSRRDSGSMRSAVCSFWLATTSTGCAGGVAERVASPNRARRRSEEIIGREDLGIKFLTVGICGTGIGNFAGIIPVLTWSATEIRVRRKTSGVRYHARRKG